MRIGRIVIFCRGDISFDNISRRKMSSQDYTMSYDRSNTGVLSERKDETPIRADRADDNQYGNQGFKDHSRMATVNDSIPNVNRK